MRKDIDMKNLTGKTLVEAIIDTGATTAMAVHTVLHDGEALRVLMGIPEDKEYKENDAYFIKVDQTINDAMVYLDRIIEKLTNVVSKLDWAAVCELMCNPMVYKADDGVYREVALNELNLADYPDCM